MILNEKNNRWEFGNVLSDVGVDGSFFGGMLEFQSYQGFCATAMPAPKPTGALNGVPAGEAKAKNGVFLQTVQNGSSFSTCLKGMQGTHSIVGSMILFSEIPVGEDAWFEFPANLPLQRFCPKDLTPYEPVCSWFSGSALHLYDGERHVTLLYRNATEKWVSGGWTDDQGRLNLFFLAAAECRLQSGEEQHLGEVEVSLGDSPYSVIRSFFERETPLHQQAPKLYGPMYCCHPFGTTDTNYSHQKNFAEYAKELPALAEMGIRTVYVLPTYAHKGHEDIYSPTDLAVIDPRYGGKTEAAEFVRAAHALGMQVIFDFVPHGPEPDSELASLHKDWCAKQENGELQSEWNCVSFDAMNPAYLHYLQQIVERHAKELELDGMRLDCAMGGCSNWDPYAAGIRASASTLGGGVCMTEAVRSGFEAAGREALLMPEMTYPLPHYQSATECFYNNTLYRVLMDLNATLLSNRVQYTQTLLRWLSVQAACKPKGQVLGNWLENHDTVLWAGDAKRAAALYGEEMADNMFRLICWMDGFPVLYQGDEAPADYGLNGRERRSFFKECFALRDAYFPYDAEIEYLPSNTAVFDFRRVANGISYRILLNLAEEPVLVSAVGEAVYLAGASACSGEIRMGGYGAAIIKEPKGETT